MATSPTDRIPVEGVLSNRQITHYKRWQNLCTTLKPSQQGFLPTATEYADFQLWMKTQDSGYFSDFDIMEGSSAHSPKTGNPRNAGHRTPVAAICHHKMHPISAERPPPRCPVCVIALHTNYVKFLMEALLAAGGHKPKCTLTTSQLQDNIYQVWCREKVSTMQTLLTLNQMARKEADWSAEHSHPRLHGVRSAAEALNIYWFDISGMQDTVTSSRKTVAVTFADDTNFELGRPQAYYMKRSLRYEPGKYTVSDPVHEDEDDGSITEDSEDYNDDPLPAIRLSHHETGQTSSSKSDDCTNSKAHDQQEEDESDEGDWADMDYDDSDSDSASDDYETDDEDHDEPGGDASYIVFSDDD